MATTINVILADSTTAITVSTGARGPAGTSAANSVTSATTSDGTAALYLDSIRFETTNGGPTQTGQMAWESTDGSIDAMLESGVIVAMGEDLVIRVRNATASPIAKGAALAYDGTVGASGRIDVKPWVGSNIATAKLFLGFAAAAIDANGNGYSQWFGKLSGINTSGGAQNWQDEQIIYAVPSASSTLTNVAPTSGEYAVAAVVINAGSGTSGILYVRPTFEKFPVSADITDATSDGQTNPGKLLKTDANGALQINTLSLGSSDIDAADPGELIIYNATDVESVYGSIKSSNLTTARDFELPNTSGTIMVGSNNLSDLSSASTARTNLGLGTGDSPTFSAITATNYFLQSISGAVLRNLAAQPTIYGNGNVAVARFHSTAGLKLGTNILGFGSDISSANTEGLSRISTGLLGIGTGEAGSTAGSLSLTNLIASGYLQGAEMTAPAAPPANGFRIFAEDNGSGKTRLMVQFATGAAQQIAIEP